MTESKSTGSVRVFGPDHEWAWISAHPLDQFRELNAALRSYLKEGYDITIVAQPWGGGDPFDYPFDDDPTVVPSPPAEEVKQARFEV